MFKHKIGMYLLRLEHCHRKPKTYLSTFCLQFIAYILLQILLKHVIYHNYNDYIAHGIHKL